MNRGLKRILIAFGMLIIVGFAALAYVTRNATIDMAYHRPGGQVLSVETPADFDLGFEEVRVATVDGLELVGWYLPTSNGATIIAQHGYKGRRQDLLYEANALHEQGFGVLLSTMRAHDGSEGELITFGYHEVQDTEAWYQYLLTRSEVNPDKIGLLGESMGGGLSIRYTAQNPGITALATASAFALTRETIEKFIQLKQDSPTWATPIIAQFMIFWVEREWGFPISELDTESRMASICPRPLLVMQGGQDDHIAIDNGQRLYDAACEPKQLWFCEECGHVDFERHRPEEYEQQIATFFDQYLLGG
jgi:fermentation-respiration switch protein FrsA (DUF1100 family)